MIEKQRTESEKYNANIDDPHPSFKLGQASASERLKLSVKLAPSCRSSVVSLDRMQIGEDLIQSGSDETLSGNKRKASNSNVSYNTEQQQQQSNPLSQNEIVKKLQRALPKCSIAETNTNAKPQSDDNYLSTPYGIEIHKCKNIVQSNELEFIFCIADGKEKDVNDYHSEVQRLSLFFIENADGVNLTSDEGGGYWKVLYVFRKHKDDDGNDGDNNVKYSFVGYTTLFCFFSPFKKPKSGIVLRICQALILPPYQGCGLGKRMMSVVYDYAHGKLDSVLSCDGRSKAEIVEVNVEDPSPSFTRLRDRIDYQMLKDSFGSTRTTSTPLLPDKYFKERHEFQSLQDGDVIAAAVTAKITKPQIQIAYEIFKLSQVINTFGGQQDADGNIEKGFRLMVKKRLNYLHREDISACTTKEDKKKKLSELYDDLFKQYKSILGRLG